MKDNKKLYPINYLGKIYNTTIHKDLTDEEFEQVRKEYYTKPDFKEVQDQFLKLLVELTEEEDLDDDSPVDCG